MKKFMEAALAEAKKAADMGEVPIGAVITKDGRIIASAHNLTETSGDPTAHAEMLAIRKASQEVCGWRLTGCRMYVTVEPCAMCAGALVWSRMEHLYIGTPDPKAGACGSVFNIVESDRLNHRVTVHRGMLEEECSILMKNFFKELRKRNKERKSNRRND